MSHFTTVATQFTDAECLVTALCDVSGWTKDQIEVHGQAAHLYGYQGDKRAQTAEIIIRRKHVGGMSNDIGFARQPDGTYGAVVSQFDSRRYGQQWQSKVAQRYAVATVKKTLPYGYQLHEEQQANGEIHVTVTSSY